jgi:regulator of RNase E activity RraA
MCSLEAGTRRTWIGASHTGQIAFSPRATRMAISSCRRGLLTIVWWPSTGVVMSRSQVSMAQTPEPELLAGFAALDCCAVSDGLDALGLPPGVGGLRPMWGAPLVLGFAVTVQVEPYVPGPAGPHIAASAVAGAGPDEVMVIANGARTDVSCWGGLLSLGAQLRGVRAAVVDGACRDVAEAQELGFAVYARGSVPASARGRLRQRSSGEPVVIADITVVPGDVVVADATGVAFVPRARAAEVLKVAAAVRERESAIAADLRAGVPLRQAMHDARLAGEHQAQR